MASIFDKQTLRPGQMIAVAQRRFDDAICLKDSEKNARANGAMYLAGFVIEILLKASLVRRYPELARRRPSDAAGSRRWELVYRRHDLQSLLTEMPDLEAAIAKAGERVSRPYATWLKSVCERWTVFARYSPYTADIADAREMIARVEALKELIR